jgi:HlyD family secretion protein
MSIRPLSLLLHTITLVCGTLAIAASALGLPRGASLIPAAQAQSAQQKSLDRARTAVETLINRLRGRDMPEGIIKSNGAASAASNLLRRRSTVCCGMFPCCTR